MSITSRRASIITLLALTLAGLAQPGDAQYYYQAPPSAYQNDTLGGTLVGGGLGAVTGAIIGGRKHGGQDALIGAGVGAITGGLLGKSKDNADARAVAAGNAVAMNANAQIAAQAVTSTDLIQMTRAGLSEDLIISTMQSRGTRLDLSPNGLIALKQNGVSDRVVLAAQQTAGIGYGPPVAQPINPAPVVVAPAYVAPPAVIVRPAPVVRIYGGYGYGWGPHYYHHRHW
jgi:hypothetical protein